MSDKENKIRRIRSNTILERFETEVLELPRIPRRDFVERAVSFIDRESRRLKDVQPLVLDDDMRQQIIAFNDRLLRLFEEGYADIAGESVRRCGGMPLIVTLFDDVIEGERKRLFDSLSKRERIEAISLADALFFIRKERKVTVVCMDNNEILTSHFPKVIRRDSLQDYKSDMMYLCANAVSRGAGIIVRTWEPSNASRAQIFGIRCINSSWFPLSVEEVKEAYCTGPYGEELIPEEGLEFVGFTRKNKADNILDFKNGIRK